jgi:hypothetical protein
MKHHAYTVPGTGPKIIELQDTVQSIQDIFWKMSAIF